MMSPSSPDSASGPADQECEINLASIIDCFTVLITYLLVSASFISLSEFDVGVAMPVFSQVPLVSPNGPSESLQIAIEIHEDLSVEVKVSGPVNQQQTIAHQSAQVATAEVSEVIKKWVQSYPATRGALITAAPKVRYREIVRVVEGLKTLLPELALGDRA